MTKSEIQFIRSLSQSKTRNDSGLFIAEGEKLVSDLLKQGVVARDIFSTDSSFTCGIATTRVSDNEMSRISQLKSPSTILGVFHIPKLTPIEDIDFSMGLTLVLDCIQDPGNLGSIIRISDWFGIRNIVCSDNSVDSYHPKVVQSSMGSVTNVSIYYTSLDNFLSNCNRDSIPIYGTFLDGEDIYTANLTKNGIIVMGNEGQGISANVSQYINLRISIPSFRSDKFAESLNVSIATAIICSEFSHR